MPDLSLHYSLDSRQIRQEQVCGYYRVEMASAYIGTCLMPPLFGLLPVSFLPFYHLIFALAVMTVMNLKLNGNKNGSQHVTAVPIITLLYFRLS